MTTLPPTSVACPFALVHSGEGVKLMWLTKEDVTVDGLRAFVGNRMARHWSKPDWSQCFKTRHSILGSKVIAQWRNMPNPKAIRRRAEAFNKRRRSADR